LRVREAGGAVSKVERSQIDAAGNLGAWEASPGGNMSAGRLELSGQALVVGEYVYVFGGRDWSTGSSLSSIERAPIDGSGNLGAFETPSHGGQPITLVQPRQLGAALQVGNYVYLIGGQTSTIFTALDQVERAPILDSQGNLGPFQDYSGTCKLTAARTGLAVAAANGKVFAVSGATSAGPLPGVQAAPILAAAGNLGNFANVGSLNAGRQESRVAVIGSDLLVLGGADINGIPFATVERAAIGADGSLGAFANDLTLSTPRWEHGTAVIRGYLYLLGGRRDSTNLVSSIERTQIPFGGAAGDLGLEVR